MISFGVGGLQHLFGKSRVFRIWLPPFIYRRLKWCFCHNFPVSSSTPRALSNINASTLKFSRRNKPYPGTRTCINKHYTVASFPIHCFENKRIPTFLKGAGLKLHFHISCCIAYWIAISATLQPTDITEAETHLSHLNLWVGKQGRLAEKEGSTVGMILSSSSAF